MSSKNPRNLQRNKVKPKKSGVAPKKAGAKAHAKKVKADKAKKKQKVSSKLLAVGAEVKPGEQMELPLVPIAEEGHHEIESIGDGTNENYDDGDGVTRDVEDLANGEDDEGYF